jgi:hypothetical protein
MALPRQREEPGPEIRKNKQIKVRSRFAKKFLEKPRLLYISY